MRFLSVYLKLVTVQAQENVGGKEGNAFITVNEGVVHDEGLEQRCGHFGKISVVAGAGTIQCAFQKAGIA